MSEPSTATGAQTDVRARGLRSLALPLATAGLLPALLSATGWAAAPFRSVVDDTQAPPLAWAEGVLGEATALSLRHAELELESDGPVYQATLTLDFRNTSGRTVEGVAWLPIAANSLERGFVVDNDGTVMQGKVRSRDLVVRAYRGITRPERGRGSDPVVLERIDDHWLRATVFPVEPGAPVEIQVSYLGTSEELGGLRRFDVPMPESRGESGGSVSFELSGRVHADLGGDPAEFFLASPGNQILDRRMDGASLAFDARVPLHHGGRAALYLGAGPNQDRLDLHCYKVADEHGYFYAEFDPQVLLAERLEDVDWCVVVDDAGLSPTAWSQVRGQLESFAERLPPSARFCFQTSTEDRRSLEIDAPRAVDAALATAWTDRMGSQRSRGQSRLAALLERARQSLSLGEAARSARVLVIAGERPAEADEAAVQNGFRELGRVRDEAAVFALGTGELAEDDTLAGWATLGSGRGLVAVDEDEIGLVLDSLRRSAEHPVLRAPQIDMAGVTEVVMDLPRVVVHGDRLRWCGRYEQPARSVVRLRGVVGGRTREVAAPAELTADSFQEPWVATWWAGEETKALRALSVSPGTDSVRYYEMRLCERFGLLGPHTVAFGVEPGLEAWMPRLVGPQNRPGRDGAGSPFQPLGPRPPRVGDGPMTAVEQRDRGAHSIPGVMTGASIPGVSGAGGMSRPAPVAVPGRGR